MKNKICFKFVFCLIVIMFSLMLFSINSVKAIVADEGELYQGIDVSGWQGYIDYDAVYESGIRVVYIKSSEGKNIDPYFELNYKNAKENGLKVGVYHYVISKSVEEAREEAEFFINLINDKSIDVKIAMDFENFEDLSNEEINEIAYTFLSTAKERYGKDIIIYSDLNNVEIVWNEKIAKEFELWLAYYNDYNLIDNLNLKWAKWIGVQYTDEGTIPGVRYLVDRDYFTESIFYEESMVNKYEPEDLEENGSIEKYRIKRGDTLWGLSRRFDTTIENIARENGIRNVNLIYVNEILNIISNYNNLDNQNSTSKIYYKVRRGDTLCFISKMYNIPLDKIIRLNDIKNLNLIFPNQILKIPN